MDRRFLGAIFLIVMTLAPTACAQTKTISAMSLRPCDVINEDFCFGLTAGDSAALSIPVDFKLYKVELASGQKLIVYYGSQAQRPGDGHVLAFSHKAGNEVVSLYIKNDGGKKVVDLFYEKEREKFTSIVHVNSAYDQSQEDGFKSFLQSFRKCNSLKKDSVDCSTEGLFFDALARL